MTSITYSQKDGDLPVLIETAAFQPESGGTGEWHLMLHSKSVFSPFITQLQHLIEAYIQYKNTELPLGAEIRFARCFVSDAANQTETIQKAWEELFPEEETVPPLSIVQQPPLDGSKLAFWLYLSTPFSSSYHPIFKASQTTPCGDSKTQMRTLLETYSQELERQDCTLELNCLRTWIFVRDVDVNYAGVVQGRTENFLTQGMNPTTHFITSTGIEGQSGNPHELVLLDSLAVKGLQREQIQFLYAPTHLNPTYEYNVTFERGVNVRYGDRQHVWISGTASINNKGEIVHPGDITLQTRRMWENVETLLAEASCDCRDLAHVIVYLRDIADYAVVQAFFTGHFPHVPTVFLWAPVCRPGWLIEMECMAIKGCQHPEFPAL